MARRGRGGRRTGQQGQAYPNRTDLQGSPQAPRVTSGGREYGDVRQGEARQAAVPLPSQTPAPTGGGGPADSMMMRGGEAPPPLSAASAQPGQPVTAGLPIGPGGGPEMLGASAQSDAVEVEQLLALYRANPTPGMARLIERLAR